MVQTGEPFDIKCHRARDAFTHHKWAHFDRFLSVRANLSRKGLHLLADEEGGLLYYCPRRDKYSPSDVFDPEVNFASVRAGLDRLSQLELKKSAQGKDALRRQEEERRDKKKAEVGFMDLIQSYPHSQIPDIERDVLEFPEPNIWAGLLRLVPPTHAPGNKKPPAAAAAAAAAAVVPAAESTKDGRGRGAGRAGTLQGGRARSGTPTRPGSATRGRGPPLATTPNRRRPSSATVSRPSLSPCDPNLNPSPAPHPHHAGPHTPTPTIFASPRSRPGSALSTARDTFGPNRTPGTEGPDAYSSTVTSALDLYGVPSPRGLRPAALASTLASPAHGVAQKFVSELGVTLRGNVVRPFSADGGGRASLRDSQAGGWGTATSDLDAAYDMALSFALGGGALHAASQGQGAGSPGNTVTTSFSHGGKPVGKLPPLLFEADLDAGNYIEFRRLVQKLSDKPLDPVLLLELVNFLHCTKLGNESLAALTRCVEVLQDWKLTHENTALCSLLVFRMRTRYMSSYERLATIWSISRTCADSPVVFARCGQYLAKLQYLDVAESLYMSALLLDPLCSDANRSLAHLLIEKGNLHAAGRYLVRVSDTSCLYPAVKVEQGWLLELMGANEEVG